jgi:hypothetical protein
VIIKGGSRAGPRQLAYHLQRRDTNELVEIIENAWPSPDLHETFRDWQTLSEGTQGWKGLYHVNIDPAEGYVMSMEQWQRCVDVLEKELGFDGQPRTVVLHQKHGRQHLHVVWARTDIDTMTMCSDGNNYLAHERASKALELEFGHELVPGKHAKRDRKKQPEFPRAEMTHAEWQQSERSNIDPRERKAEIAALKQASDSGDAFKAALEDNGYILAKGDSRAFVIVDRMGDAHSLSRQVKGWSEKDVKQFLKDIDHSALPTADEAAEIQKSRWEQKRQEPKEKHTQAEAPAPERSKPEQPSEQDRARQEEIEQIKKAVADRSAEEHRKWTELHAAQYERKESELGNLNREAEQAFRADQQRDMEALADRHKLETSGIKGLWEALQRHLNPTAAGEKADQRRRETAELKHRQAQELKDYLALREQTKQLELQNLKEQQAQQLRDHAEKSSEDLERYIREHEEARQLRADLEAREREREEERNREPGDDGPEWPPPRKPTR